MKTEVRIVEVVGFFRCSKKLTKVCERSKVVCRQEKAMVNAIVTTISIRN